MITFTVEYVVSVSFSFFNIANSQYTNIKLHLTISPTKLKG